MILLLESSLVAVDTGFEEEVAAADTAAVVGKDLVIHKARVYWGLWELLGELRWWYLLILL